MSETLREQEADLVFRVPFRDPSLGEEMLIHILIEHQSSVDKQMGFRFLGYMYNLWLAEQQRWTEANVPTPERRLPTDPADPVLYGGYIVEPAPVSSFSDRCPRGTHTLCPEV